MISEPTQNRSTLCLVRSGVVLLIGLMLVWLALSGYFTPWMIFLGAISCVLVLVVIMRMGGLDEDCTLFRIGVRLPGYVPWLIIQIILANLDVARRILSPGYRISPTLVRIKALAKTDAGVTTLANSITLTPGTISVRVRGGYILVHGISKEATAELEEGEMNRRVARLEGRAECTSSS